jgi:hypothetical protein
VKLERLTSEGVTLLERCNCMELFRDLVIEQFEIHPGSLWHSAPCLGAAFCTDPDRGRLQARLNQARQGSILQAQQCDVGAGTDCEGLSRIFLRFRLYPSIAQRWWWNATRHTFDCLLSDSFSIRPASASSAG